MNSANLPKVRQRLVSGLSIALVTLLAIIFLPNKGVLLALLGICLWGMLEFYAFLDAAQIPNYRLLGALGGVGLILATAYSLRRAPAMVFEVEGAVIMTMVLTLCLRQFLQKNNPRPIETIAGTLLGFLYIAFLLNFITKLILVWDYQTGRLLLFYLVAVGKCSEAGAYFVGCAGGRHKLIPRISPAKTWEGVLGGLGAGVLVSLVFCWSSDGQMGVLRLGWGDAVGLGIGLTVMGLAGDLTESLFKRAVGVKDSSRVIAGMGGILDIMDSLLFTAPLLFVYARWFLG